MVRTSIDGQNKKLNSGMGGRVTHLVILMASLLLVGACGSSTKKEPEDSGPDITVPPVLIGEERVEQPQADPEEVISYDEWQKRRRQAAQEAQEADSE